MFCHRWFMSRRVLQPFFAWTAALLCSGCSLFLQLDADCDTAADCGAYTCNDDNVACRSSCEEQSECGDTYVCDLGNGVCEGGFCLPVTQVVELPEPSRNFEAASSTVIFPEGRPPQLAVLSAQPLGVALKRYYLPNYRSVGDPVDEELRAVRVDFPMDGSFQIYASIEDDVRGVARFAWAHHGEQAGLRTVALDATAPWLTATETTHRLPENYNMSGIQSVSAASGTQVVWVESGDGKSRPYSQHLHYEEGYTMAQALDESGYGVTVAANDDTVSVFWLRREANWWSISAKSTEAGTYFDSEEEPAILEGGVGTPPLGIHAVQGRDHVMLFTQKLNVFGRSDYEILFVDDLQIVRRNVPYMDGFTDIRHDVVVPALHAGAWVGVVGTWGGEAGVWVRYVSETGVVDRYPVRITDAPTQGLIDDLSVSSTRDHLQVSWALRETADDQKTYFSRQLRCQ